MANNQSPKRVVLITSCSVGGIGHYLALEFAKQGCEVYASARNTSKLATNLSELGIKSLDFDVTKDESVNAAIAHIYRESGHIDILVNNAGQDKMGPVVETEISGVRQLSESNFFSGVRMCQAVAPHMMDRRQGVIVNMGFSSGYTSLTWASYYAESKAALHSLSDTLRVELALFNVKVVLVPGIIKSNIDSAFNPERFLPANSRYALAFKDIKRMSAFMGDRKPTPTNKFARHVVRIILAKNPKRYVTSTSYSKQHVDILLHATSHSQFYIKPLVGHA